MAEVSAGVRHIFGTEVLRQILIACAVALLVVGFTETLIFAVVDQGLHRPPSFVGVILAFQGVGAIAGAVVASRLLRRLGDRLLVGVGLGGFALGALILAAPSTPVVLAGVIVAGVSLSWLVVAFVTALQLRTPLPLQGRVSSAADLLVGTPQTFSIAFGAALSTVVDYRLLLGAIAAVCGGARRLAGQPAAGGRGRRRERQPGRARSRSAPRSAPKSACVTTLSAKTRGLRASGGQLPERRSGCNRSARTIDGQSARFSSSATSTPRFHPRIPARSKAIPKAAPLARCAARPTAGHARVRVTPRPSSRTSEYVVPNRRRVSG